MDISVKTKYGCYPTSQIDKVKSRIRKSIFFLLLYVDPQTKSDYPDINVEEAFLNLQYTLDGLNRILFEPPELVITMSLLESALNEFKSADFSYGKYRKLILDAGSAIMNTKEGD